MKLRGFTRKLSGALVLVMVGACAGDDSGSTTGDTATTTSTTGTTGTTGTGTTG